MLYGLEKNSVWYEKLCPFLESDSFSSLEEQLRTSTSPIFPSEHQIFRGFSLTPWEEVSVVILGQDPYHGAGQAHGLAFSVEKEVKIPPSLKNIYKELERDCHFPPPDHGDLSSWATQGVLLLNTCLTVEEGKAGSHHNLGWEKLTDLAISSLNEKTDPVVFLLWGNPAQKKEALITNNPHLVLKASHPSPLSARHSFFGCGHFSKTNHFLTSHHKKTIQWNSPNLSSEGKGTHLET